MQDILGDDLLKHVKLAIRTPSGTWPTEGFMEVPSQRDICEQLTPAAPDRDVDEHVFC